MGLTGRQFDQIVKLSRRTGITKVQKTTEAHFKKLQKIGLNPKALLKTGTAYESKCGTFEIIYFRETESYYTTNGRKK